MRDNGKRDGRGRRDWRKLLKGGIEIQLNLQTTDTVGIGLLSVVDTLSLSRELCLKIIYKCSQPHES